MANQLKMAEIQAILTLRARGWSMRRIGRELGIHRETVTRYVRLAGPAAKPANALIGMEAPDDAGPETATGPKPANAPIEAGVGANPPGWPDWTAVLPPPGHAGPTSGCEPYRAVVEAKLTAGLTAVRIHQDLVAEHRAELSYHAVRRFVGKLRQARPLPFRRLEVAPGEEAQVDFGVGAPIVIPDGEALPVGVKSRRRRTHVLRVVLSHSRKGYSEVLLRQTAEDFLRALENAFYHFGGAPRTIVTDNLKAAVLKADWFDPDLNPKLQAFAEHYATVILPTKPRTPRHKGKVERGVGYVQDNALKGRTFPTLAAQNDFLREWETDIADQRIHGTTRQQVGRVFQQFEKVALLPLPAERFPLFHEARRIVNQDGHLEVARSYYSVPPEFVGRTVWARWDSRVVRIFDLHLRQIALHVRHEPGRFATEPGHIAPQKRGGIERGTTWWLRKAHLIGAEAGRWAETVIQQRGVHGIRLLMGLVSLTHRHRDAEIDRACRVAQTHGAHRLRDIRTLLKRLGPPQEQFEFIQEHPLIRSLDDYGKLVHDAFMEVHA